MIGMENPMKNRNYKETQIILDIEDLEIHMKRNGELEDILLATSTSSMMD